VPPRGSVDIAATGAAASQESLLRQSGEERRVLGIGMDIVDLVVILDDYRVYTEEDRPLLGLRELGIFSHVALKNIAVSPSFMLLFRMQSAWESFLQGSGKIPDKPE
jgi:hypothetical protein